MAKLNLCFNEKHFDNKILYYGAIYFCLYLLQASHKVVDISQNYNIFPSIATAQKSSAGGQI